MTICLQLVDFNLREVFVSGPETPLRKNDNDKVVEKPTIEWDEHDKIFFPINARAMTILYYGLSTEEFTNLPVKY